METFKTALAILASLLTIYNFYLNRKAEKKIKAINEILIENNITTSQLNNGNFNKQVTSGENGVSIMGKGNTVTKGKDQ
ncbi:hypothetical protein [Bacillus paranthracis]|uniref:hypothetical protein n=1 Tax=Bacillus paranthracis TaxID=2026186 RepID=UPI000D6C082A|nr:hypothetical protein [Bacillus paranthracis]PWN77144.1 hypothetical protein CV741_15655 [Bacillus cereus]PWN78397.1 hypothetical protein CV717_23315 [Bacillus cereus]UHJ50054.1 hypothetical protein LU294_23685 [Bacillus paranthracis]